MAGWEFWSIALIIGLPVCVLVMSEIQLRLRRRDSPLAAPVNRIRILLLPLVGLLLLLTQAAWGAVGLEWVGWYPFVYTFYLSALHHVALGFGNIAAVHLRGIDRARLLRQAERQIARRQRAALDGLDDHAHRAAREEADAHSRHRRQHDGCKSARKQAGASGGVLADRMLLAQSLLLQPRRLAGSLTLGLRLQGSLVAHGRCARRGGAADHIEDDID